ncbi:MAG: prephenate dehydrogenase [Candidatus Marinimicrobia bacterium]|nr:prephenate dehydrogenase [Candidatus Neomarinimicrobiota bacterium]
MKICILGTGHMGAWLVEELCHDHEVAIFDKNPKKMKYFFNVTRFHKIEEIKDFAPELLINAVDLRHTIQAFNEVMAFIPDGCMLSDVTSVKNDLFEYYLKNGRPFVSTHPMFGPTFANIRELKNENAIIISESCESGKEFFRELYKSLKLNIFEYSFEEHDATTAYSLGTPFTSSMVFAACLKNQEAPGTTFRKHMEIAQGLLSEDDYLLTEIMFNPFVLEQIKKINSQLSYLTHIIECRDSEVMTDFLNKLRKNIE